MKAKCEAPTCKSGVNGLIGTLDDGGDDRPSICLCCIPLKRTGSFHRWRRGQPLSSRIWLIEIDLERHFANRNDVVVQQDCLARADPTAIDERPILAAEIANANRVIVEQESAVMSAHEFAVEPKMAVFLTADD